MRILIFALLLLLVSMQSSASDKFVKNIYVNCQDGYTNSPLLDSIEEAQWWANFNCDKEMKFVKEAVSRGIDPFESQFLECGTIPPECKEKWCKVTCITKNGYIDKWSVEMNGKPIIEWHLNHNYKFMYK